MATDIPRPRHGKATKAKSRPKPRGGILQQINARVEPKVRSGLGSPGLFPAGLIVLETTGRRSGKTYSTPLLATLAPGGYLWVTTVLGRRANWLRNAHANPNVRYWLKGRALEGRSIVAAPGYPQPDLTELPSFIRWSAIKAVTVARMLGFGVLIIVPASDDAPPAKR